MIHQIISLLLMENSLGTIAHWTKNTNVDLLHAAFKIFKIHTADQNQHLLQRMQEWL